MVAQHTLGWVCVGQWPGRVAGMKERSPCDCHAEIPSLFFLPIQLLEKRKCGYAQVVRDSSAVSVILGSAMKASK